MLKERVRLRAMGKFSKEGVVHVQRERADFDSFLGHRYLRCAWLKLMLDCVGRHPTVSSSPLVVAVV